MDGTLFVRTCALNLLEVDADALRGLRRVDEAEWANFEIDVDGSFLYWPSADVHINLEAIQAIVDPELHEKLRAEKLVYDAAFGAAVRKLREAGGLRQVDIAGCRRNRLVESNGVRPTLAWILSACLQKRTNCPPRSI